MSDRDDFERALCETTQVKLPGYGLMLAACRVDHEFYLLPEPTLTGMINIAWWAWREGRKQLTARTPAQDGCHVLH